jgi:hypothetical protein
VKTPLFRRAKAGPVGINPVARFSNDEPLPFGHYGAKDDGQIVPAQAGALAPGHNQTLNPELEAGGQASFDPGEEPFGLWVKTKQGTFHTEDARNTGPLHHAARVYPLRSRGGEAVPGAFLVAFEDSAVPDYQDAVFVLWNVKAAEQAP